MPSRGPRESTREGQIALSMPSLSASDAGAIEGDIVASGKAENAAPENAGAILSKFLEWHIGTYGTSLPKQYIGRLGKEIKDLLEKQYPVDVVKFGLCAWCEMLADDVRTSPTQLGGIVFRLHRKRVESERPELAARSRVMKTALNIQPQGRGASEREARRAQNDDAAQRYLARRRMRDEENGLVS